MLIQDFRMIGNRLLAIRKRAGLTQMEVAELAGLADRTYADIERGTVNMRIETVLRICEALHITPDEILTRESPSVAARQQELLARLDACSARDRETALALLEVYLRSLSRQEPETQDPE
jgi:transcriptional regulator with XRE-family HTH domain